MASTGTRNHTSISLGGRWTDSCGCVCTSAAPQSSHSPCAFWWWDCGLHWQWEWYFLCKDHYAPWFALSMAGQTMDCSSWIRSRARTWAPWGGLYQPYGQKTITPSQSWKWPFVFKLLLLQLSVTSEHKKQDRRVATDSPALLGWQDAICANSVEQRWWIGPPDLECSWYRPSRTSWDSLCTFTSKWSSATRSSMLAFANRVGWETLELSATDPCWPGSFWTEWSAPRNLQKILQMVAYDREPCFDISASGAWTAFDWSPYSMPPVAQQNHHPWWTAHTSAPWGWRLYQDPHWLAWRALLQWIGGVVLPCWECVLDGGVRKPQHVPAYHQRTTSCCRSWSAVAYGRVYLRQPIPLLVFAWTNQCHCPAVLS